MIESDLAVEPAPAYPSVSSRDDADVPRGLRLAAAWAWRLLVIAVAALAVFWVIGRLKLVLIPLVIALLLSALFGPAVGWLRRRVRMPRSLATALVLIAGLAAVVGTLTAVISQFVTCLTCRPRRLTVCARSRTGCRPGRCTCPTSSSTMPWPRARSGCKIIDPP